MNDASFALVALSMVGILFFIFLAVVLAILAYNMLGVIVKWDVAADRARRERLYSPHRHNEERRDIDGMTD